MLTKVFQRNLTQWGHVKTPIKPHPNPPCSSSLVRYVRNMPKIKSSCQNCFYCFFDFIRGQIGQKYWGSIFPAPHPRFMTHSKWPLS